MDKNQKKAAAIAKIEWARETMENKPIAFRCNHVDIIDDGGTFKAYKSININGSVLYKECELPMAAKHLGYRRQGLRHRAHQISKLSDYSGHALNAHRKGLFRTANDLVSLRNKIMESLKAQAPIPLVKLAPSSSFSRYFKFVLGLFEKIYAKIRMATNNFKKLFYYPPKIQKARN